MFTWAFNVDGSPKTGPVRDLRLDADGDLAVERGDLQLVAGPEAAQQGATIRLNFFQGDWFLDLEAGVPYWSRILIKHPNLVEVREWIRLAILDTPDINEVLSINLVLGGDRALTVSYRASALSGIINAKGSTS